MGIPSLARQAYAVVISISEIEEDPGEMDGTSGNSLVIPCLAGSMVRWNAGPVNKFCSYGVHGNSAPRMVYTTS